MKTAVLLIVFNRIDTAAQVLERILASGCTNLYLYSDGPRTEKSGEAEQLKEVQQSLLAKVPKEVKLTTQFSNKNQGPRIAVGEAISWFFEQEEEGIIFEHDCLPHPDFFPFCESLLAHYRNDERIMHISGDNFQFGKQRGEGSYYFSRLNHIWGFATWRRAWKHYDPTIKDWPEFKANKRLNDIYSHKRMQKIWEDIFDKTHSGELQTWDYQWTFSMWRNNGLAILPQQNLVSNIGFDSKALNTTNPDHPLAAMETQESGEIIHPKFILPIIEADEFSILEVFNPTIGKFAWQKVKRKLEKL
ncbi:MAG: hypothetical protein LCH37_00905 [Bacteroidetes bacterium]|nr:hypothetical protein [Bacteroidota bacterium]